MANIELEIGMKIKCNRLAIGFEPIYEILEVTNNPLYKLPNVTVLNSNGEKVLVTDFKIINLCK